MDTWRFSFADTEIQVDIARRKRIQNIEITCIFILHVILCNVLSAYVDEGNEKYGGETWQYHISASMVGEYSYHVALTIGIPIAFYISNTCLYSYTISKIAIDQVYRLNNPRQSYIAKLNSLNNWAVFLSAISVACCFSLIIWDVVRFPLTHNILALGLFVFILAYFITSYCFKKKLFSLAGLELNDTQIPLFILIILFVGLMAALGSSFWLVESPDAIRGANVAFAIFEYLYVIQVVYILTNGGMNAPDMYRNFDLDAMKYFPFVCVTTYLVDIAESPNGDNFN